MSRKQGPHFMGMRPTAIAAGRRQETVKGIELAEEAAA